MKRLKRCITYLIVLLLGCMNIMPISATSTTMNYKKTYYEISWEGESNVTIGTADDVFIDAYYSFDISSWGLTDVADIRNISYVSDNLSIGADSYFVSKYNTNYSLTSRIDYDASTTKTLVVMVSHGTATRAALRYLGGRGSNYQILGSMEVGYGVNIYELNLDADFAIAETNTIEDKKDFNKEIYVTGYTLVGDTINKNTPFNIGINVVDPNFTYASLSNKSFDKSFAIITGDAFGSNNRQGYINDIRPDTMGYLMYTVWFENVRYLNPGSLEFSVSYNFGYTENGKAYNADQTKTASTPIYELANSSGSSNFIPNVIISNYTGQNGMVAGKNLEIKVDLKNTNKDIDVHNVIVTVDGGSTFQQTKGVNKFFIDSIEAGKTSTITLNVTCPKTTSPGSYAIDFDMEYQYISGGETLTKNVNGKISIPVIQTDRLMISYVKMSNVYQNSESEVSYSIINSGMSTILNSNLEIINANGEVLGSMFLGNLEPSKEAKGSNIYIMFPEVGEQVLTARVTYEDSDFNSKTLEEEFTVNVMSMGGGWYEPPYIEPEMPIDEPKNNNGMLWVGLAVVAVAGVGGFVFYKKKKNKGVIDDEDL